MKSIKVLNVPDQIKSMDEFKSWLNIQEEFNIIIDYDNKDNEFNN